MEVKKVATYISQSLQKPQEAAPRPNTDEKAVSGKDASLPPDRVELSKGYQGMAQVKKVMMERGDVRMEQVDQIRSMIEKGTYQIDPEKIAEKMLEELM
ncbi:MAG: flagellar biosynthesis anti-sigma factor FlgM [Deltaproteobacteria bacterium]|jgi:negative regulator of flagellin synthesis FlgM|nr:flagellar biosynthesis anti-sigma factor FlgM [Deltaproteobacteria bacterium]